MLGPLIVANLKMLVRNRQALFWAIAFPLIFVFVFGLFNVGKLSTSTIAIIDYAQDDLSRELVQNLGQIEIFEIEERQDEAEARKEVEDGDLRFLLIIPQGLATAIANNSPTSITLVFDEGNLISGAVIRVVERFLDQVNLSLVGAPTLLELHPQGILARQLDYFDFLLPGLVGMGVMTFSIIGIATAMALYREQKILKRILATPLRVRTFFAAMVIAYLVVSVVQTAIIFAAGVILFDAHVFGNYLEIGLLIVLGNLIFLSIGFIVGALAKNVQAASGLGNAVALPMMFLSGAFFPTEDLPDILSTIVGYLPLTPLLDALRGVALDAKSFWEFPQEMTLLAVWVVASSLVAVRVFRFR